MKHPPDPARIRRVLVMTKHRFLGDTIVAIPLMRAARQAFPGAEIVVLTGPPAATILQHCPHVDRVISYDRGTARRDARGNLHLMACLLRLTRQIRHDARPDLVLVADRSFRAALGALLCGGRIRAGFDSEGRGWLLTAPVPYDTQKQETQCCLDILRAVAPEWGRIRPEEPVPELRVTAEERKRGAGILAEYGLLPTARSPLVGIQPGASHPEKAWHPTRFAAVAEALVRHPGARIVLVGGPEETAAAAAMCQTMDAPAVDLTGKTTLRETMAVLTHLKLFVGNDTGVNHIAAALGTPTVALFGPTPARKWGNFREGHAVLTAPDGQIASIATAAVIAAAERLLPPPPVPAAVGR